MEWFVVLYPKWTFFLGRFHPLLIHLPIGFLLLAFILEFWQKRQGKNNLTPAITISLGLGALSAIFAATTGWFIGNEGSYTGRLLFIHRWSGIGVAILSTLAWALRSGKLKWRPGLYRFASWGFVLLMMVAGHVGGSLTHGEGYLFKYAPAPIAALFGHGLANEKMADMPRDNPDSLKVYRYLVKPVLEAKCVQCHSAEKKNGGLALDTPEGILKGGDTAPAIVAGKAAESEIFQRVTLPQSDPKFMPEGGNNPMTYKEIQILKWWIKEGASFTDPIASMEVDQETKQILKNDYGIHTEKRPYLETASIAAATSESIEKVKQQGFKISPIAGNSNFLDVSWKKGQALSLDQIKALSTIGPQIAWLNLIDCQLSNAHLSITEQLPNLVRLQISNNPVSDDGIAQLKDCKHLESVNMYGTQISDVALNLLGQLPALQSLYLWQTNVSTDAIEKFKTQFPTLTVDTGFQFSEVNSSSEVPAKK